MAAANHLALAFFARCILRNNLDRGACLDVPQLSHV